jgi:perosamine synthetase
VATPFPDWAAHLRRIRNHGISRTAAERERAGTFRYEMAEWGHNFRLNDIQCALGVAQMRRLPQWLTHRRMLADRYDHLLMDIPGVEPLVREPDRQSAWHLYTVRLRRERFRVHRDEAHRILLAEGIGVNVHYLPVHLHAWYQQNHGTRPGQCPAAEAAYEELLTLPLSAAMGPQDQDDVLEALRKLVAHRGIA